MSSAMTDGSGLVVQGQCALEAENTVKLFTMDQVEQQKTDAFTYEIALQVCSKLNVMRCSAKSLQLTPAPLAEAGLEGLRAILPPSCQFPRHISAYTQRLQSRADCWECVGADDHAVSSLAARCKTCSQAAPPHAGTMRITDHSAAPNHFN